MKTNRSDILSKHVFVVPFCCSVDKQTDRFDGLCEFTTDLGGSTRKERGKITEARPRGLSQQGTSNVRELPEDFFYIHYGVFGSVWLDYCLFLTKPAEIFLIAMCDTSIGRIYTAPLNSSHSLKTRRYVIENVFETIDNGRLELKKKKRIPDSRTEHYKRMTTKSCKFPRPIVTGQVRLICTALDNEIIVLSEFRC